MSRLQIQTGCMRALTVLALALLVTACGGNSGGTGQKPGITSFTATPPTVDAGQTSTLAWTVTGDAPITLTIDKGVGTVTGQTSKGVSPTVTTTYTLTAENSAGEDTETVTVTVGSQACTDPVAIPDANLAQAIRETLGKASGDLTCADMPRLTELEVNERDIGSLEGLQYAVNLTSLDLRDNAVTDISPLMGLAKLEELYLNRNPVTSISGLGNLTSLANLGLESLGLVNADIAGLAGLTKLEFLGLEDNDISDVSVVSGLTNLLQLEFQDNEVTDISALANLTKLRALFMERNQVADVSALANLSDLVALIAYENNISDLSPLADLTNMQYFYVSDNPVGSIEVVANYEGLLELGAARTGITDLSPVVGKPLTYLWLNGNESLTDFSAIASMTTLEVLLAGGTGFSDDDMPLLANKSSLQRLQLWANEGVSDISVLANLSQLTQEIDIGGTSVTDLSPIHGLTELQRLRVFYLGLTDADIEFLRDFNQLEDLRLDGNELTDISTLVDNSAIADGDKVNISNNLLDLSNPGVQADVQALLDRGVDLTYEPQNTPPDITQWRKKTATSPLATSPLATSPCAELSVSFVSDRCTTPDFASVR